MHDVPKVIIDTNFFLLIPRFKLDIFKEVRAEIGNCEFIVSKGILDELNRLSKTDRDARFVLNVLKKTKVKVVENNDPVDRWIFRYSKQLKEEGFDVYVCTNDLSLRKRLKSIGVKTVILRGYGRIAVM